MSYRLLTKQAINASRITAMVFCSLILSPLAFADEVDFRLSNDAVNLNYANLSENAPVGMGLGHFYRDDDESTNITNLDLFTQGQTALGNLPTTVYLGMHAVYLKEGRFKGSATAIGGTVRSNIPDVPGLSVEGTLYYAPDILAYGDSDSFLRTRLQTNYRIIQNADVVAGYRYLRSGVENDDHISFESGFFVGLRVEF